MGHSLNENNFLVIKLSAENIKAAQIGKIATQFSNPKFIAKSGLVIKNPPVKLKKMARCLLKEIFSFSKIAAPIIVNMGEIQPIATT